jgi:hypothetical protein
MAKDQYPVIIVADDALDLPEQLGTKEKYWLKDGQGLFKIGRLNTGENWAEKVAAELCGLLHLPHANYELATFKQQKGVLSQTIVPINGQLEMGNQLLAEIHSNYPSHERYKVTDHTFGRIHHYLQSKEILLPLDWEPPGTEIKTAFDVFVGYLLLDTWIANQDRHHENWGVIRHKGEIYLAPTYDHAASMGQNETDETRKDRLNSQDNRRHISAYIEKARSAIYLNKSDQKPLSTLEVFKMAAERNPESARLWKRLLADISQEQCLDIFEKIPQDEISSTAIEFALELLKLNQSRILNT